MESKTDKITERIKEALGALTDNDDLKRSGQSMTEERTTTPRREPWLSTTL